MKLRRAGVDIADFSGGLNTRNGAGAIADNQYADAKNVYLVGGGIAKRKGYARYNGGERISSANEGTGIVEAPFTGGSQVIGVAGTGIAVKGTDEWTSITGAVTVTADKFHQFTMINNVLVGVNGTNPPWYYTGSGNATTLSGTNIPTAPSVCETFKGRLFLNDGRNLWWSEYMGKWNEPFNSGNYQPFEGTLTGIKTLGMSETSYMYVFTGNSITACIYDTTIAERVGGSGIFRFDTITNQHGCAARNSLQECYTAEGSLILVWADKDGLKALSNENKVIKLTSNIQPTWDDLSLDKLSDAVGVFYKPRNWYLLFCCGENSDTHDTVIVYDLEKWVVVGVFDWDASTAGIVTEDGCDILVGSDYSGYWNHYDYGENDNDVAIDAYFKTKAYNCESAFYDKSFRSISVQYASWGNYTINIIAYFNHMETNYAASFETASSGAKVPFIVGEARLGQLGQAAVQSLSIRGRGRLVQLKVYNDEADEPFEIHNMAITGLIGRRELFK